jgi:hypothetical protein
MGYYSRFTGSIDIDPPLPWGLIKDHPALPANNAARRSREGSIVLILETEEVETEDGTLVKRRAVAIEPMTDDSMTAYNIAEEIQSVVDLARPHHDSGRKATSFTGRIDRLGEDGERERFKVIDGKVRAFTPELVWPEEAE